MPRSYQEETTLMVACTVARGGESSSSIGFAEPARLEHSRTRARTREDIRGSSHLCGTIFVLGLRLTLASHGDLDVGDRMHAILRPLKEVTAAVAMALGETSI